MDLGDPRESLVSLNTPGTWEADNRVEERWQWGAQLLDLCNLSPEDYKNSTAVTVKTIQDCGECGGGGGSQVEDNKGTASISDNGEFSIEFESPVASNLYVFVTFTDDLGEDYSFMAEVAKGSDTATYDISSLSSMAPFTITNIELGFKEDGSDAGETAKDKKYEYSASYGGGGDKKDGKTYVLSILCTKTDDLEASDYEAIIDAQGQGFDYLDSYDEVDFGAVDTVQATFFVTCQAVEHWMPEDEEEAYFADHSYDFVFLTQKSITEIKEDFTTDTENWMMETITLNGKTYEKWMRRDLSGAQCPYYVEGETPGDDYELTYILKIKK